MAEAEAHHGPSLVIAYSPCAMHGIASMGVSATDAKLAVDSGESRCICTWQLPSTCACFCSCSSCQLHSMQPLTLAATPTSINPGLSPLGTST